MKNRRDEEDILIGINIKLARRFRRVSQMELGKLLGITYQQIQKYESGKSRISALYLYKISRKLEFPLAFFFTPHMEYKHE